MTNLCKLLRAEAAEWKTLTGINSPMVVMLDDAANKIEQMCGLLETAIDARESVDGRNCSAIWLPPEWYGKARELTKELLND